VAPDALTDFYGRQVFGSEIQSPATITAQRLQIRRVLGDGTGRTLVDIGCGGGAGTTLLAAAAGATTVVGVDLSEPALERGRSSGRYCPMRASGTSLALRDGGADAVVLDDVIEHLVDPDALLVEIRRVLRPGGVLFLSTPNLAAWFNRAALLAGTQPAFSEVSLHGIYGRPGSVVVGHLRLFTLKALRGLLDANGFDMVHETGAGYHELHGRAIGRVDSLLARRPSLAAILIVAARKRA
jgi:SAM-dependent methyltransferase